MPRLDPDLIMHHLNVTARAKLVKQKLRNMHPHIALLVKAELKKLLDVRFIQPIAYPEWVSNIVPISKPDKSIRVCIDFRDLNKACPKDVLELYTQMRMSDVVINGNQLVTWFTRYTSNIFHLSALAVTTNLFHTGIQYTGNKLYRQSKPTWK